jgi:hypothetical protein
MWLCGFLDGEHYTKWSIPLPLSLYHAHKLLKPLKSGIQGSFISIVSPPNAACQEEDVAPSVLIYD